LQLPVEALINFLFLVRWSDFGFLFITGKRKYFIDRGARQQHFPSLGRTFLSERSNVRLKLLFSVRALYGSE